MEILKIPLSEIDKPKFIEPNFTPFTKLKLNYLENKNKLKSEFVVQQKQNTQLVTRKSEKHKNLSDFELSTIRQNLITKLLNSGKAAEEKKSLETEPHSRPAIPISENDKMEQSYTENQYSQEILEKEDNEIISEQKYSNFENTKNKDKDNGEDFSPSITHIDHRTSETYKDDDEDVYVENPEKFMNKISDKEEDEEINQKTEEELSEERYDLLYSLKMLKRVSNIEIPVYDDKITSLKDLRSILRNVKRSNILENNMDNLKSMLKLFLSFSETVSTKFLSLDLTGFTNNEMKQIDKYNPMLFELSERNYLKWSTSLPLEFKLFSTIFFSMAVYARENDNKH